MEASDTQPTLPPKAPACPVCDDGLACTCYAAGIQQIDQHGDLKALITDGRHLYRLLDHVRESVRGIDLDQDEFGDLAGTIEAIPLALHEWEKRARRAGVDWWNR